MSLAMSIDAPSLALCSLMKLFHSEILSCCYRIVAWILHPLLLLARLAVNKLVAPEGWVDQTMQIGRVGMFNIIKANWAEWDVKEHGNLINNLKHRGVDDTEALPNYHYRDDALLLWNAMIKYVKDVVQGFYGKYIVPKYIKAKEEFITLSEGRFCTTIPNKRVFWSIGCQLYDEIT